jgi:hypothetical protein
VFFSQRMIYLHIFENIFETLRSSMSFTEFLIEIIEAFNLKYASYITVIQQA